MKRKDADEALEIARDGDDEDDEDLNENEELRSEVPAWPAAATLQEAGAAALIMII